MKTKYIENIIIDFIDYDDPKFEPGHFSSHYNCEINPFDVNFSKGDALQNKLESKKFETGESILYKLKPRNLADVEALFSKINLKEGSRLYIRAHGNASDDYIANMGGEFKKEKGIPVFLKFDYFAKLINSILPENNSDTVLIVFTGCKSAFGIDSDGKVDPRQSYIYKISKELYELQGKNPILRGYTENVQLIMEDDLNEKIGSKRTTRKFDFFEGSIHHRIGTKLDFQVLKSSVDNSIKIRTTDSYTKEEVFLTDLNSDKILRSEFTKQQEESSCVIL